MSIQTTPFLHLPQWTAEEQPSFLGEINPAWAAIDTGYGDIKTSTDTAITTANAAVNTANMSKTQSEANAGQITQLQQKIQNLENGIAQSQVLQYHSVDTVISEDYANMIKKITGGAVYNRYCCIITVEIQLNNNLVFTLPKGKHALATLALPFTYSTLNLNTDISTINTGIRFGETETAAVIYCQITEGKLMAYFAESYTTLTTTNPANINIRASFPIFSTTDNKNTVPENCLFLTSD